MILNPLAANMTELSLGNGVTVLFSYKTPVACRIAAENKQEFYRTAKKWSATTTRHINKWLVLSDNWENRIIGVKPQEWFDSLITGVK